MSKEFWHAVGIRAVRTMAQTAVSLIPAAAMVTQVDWVTVAYTAMLSGILSVLTSVATGLPEVSDDA